MNRARVLTLALIALMLSTGAAQAAIPASSAAIPSLLSTRVGTFEMRSLPRFDSAGIRPPGPAAVLPLRSYSLAVRSDHGTFSSVRPALVRQPEVRDLALSSPGQPGFEGLTLADDVAAGFGAEPPDPWVAVGPSDVVQTVNSLVRVSDRAGNPRTTVTADTFFNVPVTRRGASDPRVVFDALHQRWVGVYASWDCQNGYLHLVVSATADPMGVWVGWYFTYPGSFPDYPGMGLSTDKIALSANEFSISTGPGCLPTSPYMGSSITVVDWASIDGTSLTAGYFAASTAYWTWRPARNLSAHAAIYLVAEGASGNIIYATLSGTIAQANLGLQAIDLTSSLGLTPFGNTPPPAPRQPGSPPTIADAVDERPTDALWQNGSLWFVSTIGCVPLGDSIVRDCVRVNEITTSPSPAARQDMFIGFNGYDAFMGGIGLAANGNAFFVYSASSPTSYVSTWANSHESGDALNSVQATSLVRGGTGAYSGTRWGDYVGVAQDPLCPGSVWQADEVPVVSGGWSTWVSGLSSASPAAPCAPSGAIATARDASALVWWSAPSFDGGSPVTGYTVTSAPAGSSCATAGTLACSVSGLANGTSYTFTVRAVNSAGSSPPSIQSNVVMPMPRVTRLSGSDRFATAAAVSAATFGPGVDVAYIAYAFNFPDALAGAAAAGTIKGPVLLADSALPLNASTIDELIRLVPKRIIVLGGPGVIGDGVKNALGAYAYPGAG